MKYRIIRTRLNNEVVYEGTSWFDAMEAITKSDECDEIDFFEDGKLIWNGEENTWGDLYEYDMRHHDGEWIDNHHPSTGATIV